MKKYNVFANISLGITALYCILNLIAVVEISFSLSQIISPYALTLDVFTWLIYAIFAVLTFVFKVVYTAKNKKEKLLGNKNLILHFIFTVLSFIGICYMFNVAF